MAKARLAFYVCQLTETAHNILDDYWYSLDHIGPHRRKPVKAHGAIATCVSSGR